MARCLRAAIFIALTCTGWRAACVGAEPQAADSFAVPERAAELLPFIAKLESLAPQGATVDAMLAAQTKAMEAIVAAADKVLDAKPSDKDRLTAWRAKFGAMLILKEFGDQVAEKRLNDFNFAYRWDRQPQIAELAQEALFMPLDRMFPKTATDATRQWEQVKEILADRPADFHSADLTKNEKGPYTEPSAEALYLARQLEGRPATLDVAKQAYRDLTQLTGKDRSKQLRSDAAFAEGALRRLGLLGKPMKLWGQLLDGRPFDPSTLNGKVVLVNVVSMRNQLFEREPFAELKRHFEQYRSKGLEVVAIVDAIEDNAFEQLVEQEPLPWPAIVDKSKNADEYRASMTYYYGFNFEGVSILLNRKGEVVSLDASGDELDRQLTELLGPPAVVKAATEPPHASGRAVKDSVKIELCDEQLRVPNGSPDELLKYIRGIKYAVKKATGSEADWVDQPQAEKAILAAAEKILADKGAIKARFAAADALYDSARYHGDAKRLREFAAKFAGDPDENVRRVANEALADAIEQQLQKGDFDAATGAKAWTELKSHLSSDSEAPFNYPATQIASRLSRNPATTQLASDAYRELIAQQRRRVFGQAHPGGVMAEAGSLTSYFRELRRLELVGKSFEIKGTLAEGGAFDPATVKGKVVLVEVGGLHFCGREEELKNVKSNYEKYHARGFEVVEVLPADFKDLLTKMREKGKITWPIIFEPSPYDDEGVPERDGKGNGMMQRYGYDALNAFLLDQSGKVVSVNASGDELGRQLEILLKETPKP